ncbi:unnamed protein product [Leuciscus chuanchicus]
MKTTNLQNNVFIWMYRNGEDTFELHALQSELEAVEKQIHDLLLRQAELRDRCLALETSRADAHKSVFNVTNPLTPTTSTPCVPQHRSRSAMVSFTPAPTRHHEAWVVPQRKTRVRFRPRLSPTLPVFESSTQNRFSPLRETERDAVIIGDSIVRHVHATLGKSKVHSHCFPGARVSEIAARVPEILNGDERVGTVILHAGVNDIRLRQTEILKKDFRNLIDTDLEKKIIIFLKNELEKFKKILNKGNTQYFVQDFIGDMRDIKEAALDITLYFLRDMKQVEAADALQDELVLIHQRTLKSNLKNKYQSVSEGIAKHGDAKLLNNIYTDLYMTQGASKQVNTEHEVRQIQDAARRQESQEIPVECKNLFEAPEQDKEIRTVLTKGVAGIGKSISVQKFIVDWAEGKENQDITFIFPFAFREMNLKEKEKQSLTSLISQFFPEIKRLNLARKDTFKVLFIFDGLDECRLPLNFDGNETWCDVWTPASLDVLLTNLIKGNLVPSAKIWITTRPAAAIKIPPECIDRVTEVQGFYDAHKKEEYFRKRFTDENLANKIIDNVKQSKSLFIMCYIPVFCWISATVLQNILEEKRSNDVKNNQADEASKTLQEPNTEDTLKTLTQMYTHFFRFQIQQSRRKYDGEYTPDVSWDKDAILSLGKLAFHELERNNLIFYGKDLEACGIDASKALEFSGMCTQIFKEERGIILGTTYCFVHLSIQEFIAALYAHLFQDIESAEQENKNEAMIDLLKTAVDKALESETGHLDLFLRFLLGLSLQSNRRLLRGLLTQQEDNDQCKKEIVKYIKQKFEDNLSPERSINLFYCLNELNDQTLLERIQTQLREGNLSSDDLSPAQWSAVAFVLLTSEEEMEEFELQKFKKSDECLFRLLEVVKISKRALLNDCDLTDKSCSSLAKALDSDNNLEELNMSNNNLQDSGLIHLCSGLKSVKCKLEILRLSQCAVTEESCSALASVLSSDSSSLKYLDLSNNNLKDSGVKLFSDGLKENCKLEKLRLSDCSISEEGYKALASALRSNPSHLIELDLTGNDPGQSGVKELSDLLQDPNCHLKTLRLNNNSITEEGCSALTSAFNSNLIELDLSGNKLGNSGIMSICPLLENAQCRLEKLKLSDCRITEEGYKALASALRSNPSHLIELDLTGNDPGQSGVKELLDVAQKPDCKLTLIFLKSPAAQEACEYLTKVLGKSPLLLTELDLSGDKLGDLDGEKLSALLMDSHSKVQKIKLNNCELTEKSGSVLATVLSSKTILKEMNLNNSRLLDSGVKEICEGLKNPVCELKILKLSKCDLTEESCSALSSVLSSNSSSLMDLDLSNNNLQDLRAKLLSDGLKENCKLEKLRLNNYEMTKKSCAVLATVLSSKNTILKEMDLNNSRLLDSGVKEICKGLKKSKLKILKLSDCSISEEGYKALASALRSNPSHLIELDLTGNDPGQSGVKELDDLLQDPNCHLKTLRFLGPAADEACQYVRGIVGKSPLLLRKLDLSKHELGDTRVKQIAALLQDKHCKLCTLHLCGCSITEEQCFILTSALKSNPSHLRELDLSGNEIRNTGVKHLCDVLKDSHCKLERLRLRGCKMTDEGCSAVTSALKSNPSHLRELDLSENKLGDSGVKNLSDLLMNPQCKLEKLGLCKCSITEKQCLILTSALKSNPSHLRELDLNGNKLENTGVNHLCDVLKDSHCKLERLSLCGCSITEEQCFILTSALKSNPSHLRELDLSGNEIRNTGVKHLCDVLKDSHCKLERLRLRGCKMTDEGCSAVTSALKSNPSHLRELDLSENKLGDSGVKNLSDLLMNPQCKLEKLGLCKCSITEKQCLILTSALKSNPSHLRELDLNGNKLENTGVNHLCDVLKDSHCKLERLRWRPFPPDCTSLLTLSTNTQNGLTLEEEEEKEEERDLESKIITLLKNELEKFKKILQKENTQSLVKDFNENRCSIKEAALDFTLHYLREMKQYEAADTLKDELIFNHQLKCGLKKKYQCVFEGIAKQGDSTLLNNIYTDLYITQGCSEQVNTEHEVRQIEVASRHHESQEIPVECKNLFEAPEQDKEIRTVLTKGVAGIGKSVSVQKFVLDWAEGKENQDISFIFPLPFREMNLKKKEKQSLMGLITRCFPETKGLSLIRMNNFKVLFILDGLDECRLPLKFDGNETLSDVSSPASLDVLLTNLIKGNLLPSALIWITTRPAAASKIPPDCIDRVTEIRGFNDAQKEEYFRKRFIDEKMANEIIDHVKQSKSLFIMCHIPVFCWISATVLQNILEEKRNNDVKHNQSDEASKTLQESNTEDTPKTLTQMYTHFLRFQIQQSRRKYDGEYTPDVSWDKDAILSLGKLAFQELERNNLIFYYTDLEDCGINIYKASVYSGMCTQIFKEERGIILGTMYCFVHLSIQEFIAGLYAHLFQDINKKSAFDQESAEQDNKNEAMIDLLKTAVDKALESDNGHLDLFLRFLLGLSLQSNRRLLPGLLTQQEDNDQSKKEIVQYIKQKLESDLSPERSINLFYCLNELNDQTLVKEIQTHLSKGSLSSADLSPAQWSALAFVLLTSEEEIEEFELQKFKKSDECLIRLSAVIKTSKRALLNNCDLTDKSCSALAKVLGSDNNLKELNMNNNNLQDSGVKMLCTGLKNIKCKLEILRLSNCRITEEGYKALASALRSNPSHLIELDLTGNDPGQSGVKELNDLLQDPNCQLKTLRFLSPDAEEACQYVRGIVGKSPLLLRELNLSDRELGDTRVNQISALLQDKHCKLNTLNLWECSITEKQCLILTSALKSNPSHLRALILDINEIRNTGVNHLCDVLKDSLCKLEILRLCSCTMTDEGCSAVTSALKSNPSHLRELNLSGNKLGDSGVKNLSDLLMIPQCKLEKLELWSCSITEEQCLILTSALKSNPSHLRELNLSGNKLGDSGVKNLSDLLMNPQCKLEKLQLKAAAQRRDTRLKLYTESAYMQYYRGTVSHPDFSSEIKPITPERAGAQ